MTTYFSDLYIQRLYNSLAIAQGILLLTGTGALVAGYKYPSVPLAGLGSVVACTLVTNSTRKLKGYLEDDEALVEDAWQYRKLQSYREPKAPVVPVQAKGIKVDPNQYPHFMILGVTGSGKSTLAAGLMDSLPGIRIAIAPHWKAGDYPGCHYILGHGRYYGTSEDRTTERISTLVDKGHNLSCVQALSALVAEMDYRYQLVDGRYRYEVEQLPRIEVVLDEYPAWGTIKGVKEMLTQLLLEARKVGIRLWVLSQGAEVSMLGIEGNGSLREQMCLIRGRGFLKGIGLPGTSEELPGSVDCSKLPKEVQEYLKSQQYPWLIEGKPLDPTGLFTTPVDQKVSLPVDFSARDDRYGVLCNRLLDLGWSQEDVDNMSSTQ